MGADITWCVEQHNGDVWLTAEEEDQPSVSGYRPYSPAQTWPASWYSERNYWLYSVLLGLDVWAGLPGPRGLPPDMADHTSSRANYEQVYFPSWHRHGAPRGCVA